MVFSYSMQMSPNFHTVETSDKWLGCWLWQHAKSGRLTHPRGGNTCWQTSTVKLGSKSSWHTNRHEPKLRTNKQINSQWVHFECWRISLYPYPLATGLAFILPYGGGLTKGNARETCTKQTVPTIWLLQSLSIFHIMANKCVFKILGRGGTSDRGTRGFLWLPPKVLTGQFFATFSDRGGGKSSQ